MPPTPTLCWSLQLRESGAVVVPRLQIASTFWRRFAGWQFRSRPAPGEGLLLAPENAVHTCCMRFAIDLAFLSREGEVLRTVRELPPWRATWPVRGAVATLEQPAGELKLAPGDQIRLIGPQPIPLLANWC